MLGILFLTAGVLGVGAWGIEAGIHETNGAVGQFFGIVAGFQVAVSTHHSASPSLHGTQSSRARQQLQQGARALWRVSCAVLCSP